MGAASVLLFAAAGVAAALAATQLGSTYIFDQPQPTLQAVLVLAELVAVVAVALFLSLVAVCRVDGWSLWRRLHHTGFALSVASFAGLLLYWGLAFGGPI